MKLNLKRPIVFFDLETTGVDTAKDRIVEISMVKVGVCWHPINAKANTKRIIFFIDFLLKTHYITS